MKNQIKMIKTRSSFGFSGWMLLFVGLWLCSVSGWSQTQGYELTGKAREKNIERIEKQLKDFYDAWLGACVDEDPDFIEAIGESYVAPNGVFKPDFGKFPEDGLWSFSNYCTNFRILYQSMYEEPLKFRQSNFRFIYLKSVDGGNSVEADFTFQSKLYSGERLITSAEVEAVMLIDAYSPTNYKLKQIAPTQPVTVHYSPEEEKATPLVTETPKEEEQPSLVETLKEETVVPPVETPTMDVSEQRADGEINGHEYVDLGLSVKWATCNVGASDPSDYGDYFAWGETSPKSEYRQENSETWEKNIGDIGGNARYDAARANWGGSWRLPTLDEIKELKNKCKWIRTTQGGHKGYKVVGPSGKSIFLPAAGWRYGTSLYYVGELGYYWSSTPYESNTQYACSLYFDSSSYDWRWNDRRYGRSVRPVSD